MKDYPIERIYRDARITNIYEGTSQLQVVAAIRHVTTGTYLNQIREYEAQTYAADLGHVHQKLIAMRELYERAVEKVTAAGSNEFIDFHARRMVEMAAHIIIGYLLLRRARSRNTAFPPSFTSSTGRLRTPPPPNTSPSRRPTIWT